MNDEPSRKPSALRPEWALASAITLVIVYFHVHFWLNAGGFWRDEVNTINVAARHSLSGMAHDAFPVLMPLLFHGWLALVPENHDLALRAFGLVVGLCIPAALWIVSWKARRSPPLLGLALFGLNSILIVWGDSIRAYGLGCLFIILTAGAALVFLQKPSWPRVAWFCFFCVLSVQTLYHNAVFVGAVCLGTMAVCARRKLWRAAAQIFIAGAVAAVSLLPYWSILNPENTSSAVLKTGLKSWRFFEGLHDTFGFPFEPYLYVWAILLIIVVGLAIFGWRRDANPKSGSENDLPLFAAATVISAVAGYCLFLRFAGMPSQSWYWLPLMALAVVCLDAAWPVLRGPLSAIFFGFVAATALISVPVTARNSEYHLTNVNVLARALSKDAAPQDYIVVVPWFCGISFDHYFKASTPWDTLPPLSDHSGHRYDLVKAQLQNTNAIVPVLKHIAATLQSGHRVWVLAGAGWMDVPEPGTTAPSSLPPAPLPGSGWSDEPYTMVWDSQVGHYLGNHSLNFQRVANAAANIRAAEEMELFMVSGWQTNSAAP